MTTSIPLLHEAVSALADRRLTGRRWIDRAAKRQFQASMRNDFLTPRGTPYKWQEMTAGIERTVISGGWPTVVPVRYRWQRVDARTGTPTAAGERREWTFARGQSFSSMLLHTELGGQAPMVTEPAGTPPTSLEIGYPGLPKSPAVDLLLMLSWDVVTFEMMCTHLTTTPQLRAVGGCAELERMSGTWAELQFSDPGAVAVFRNARVTARHLGYGRFAGRPSAVYSSYCLDCVLDVRSGPVTQRGRSSCWVTLQADVETADLLSADMTEMIVATLTGPDGRRVPVCKRRIVRMWVAADAPGTLASSAGLAAGEVALPVADPVARAIGEADAADLADAIRFAGRVADYLAWQASSLEHLPQGMSELALMGFRSVVGTDIGGTYRQVRSLQADLRAVASREQGADARLREALPEHRRRLEGLLAFGQLAADGANRGLVPDEADRKATRARLNAIGADLTKLLALLDRLERPARPDPCAPTAGSVMSPPQPPSASVVHHATDQDSEG